MRRSAWGARRLVLRVSAAFAVVVALLVLGAAAAAAASTWSLEPVQQPGNGGALFGVSCTATNACEAVGNSSDFGGNWFPMAQVWDGTSWSPQATQPLRTSLSGLGGVSCVSASWCMAVGSYNPPGSPFPSTLAEEWNGSGGLWFTVPSPSPGAGGPNADLLSVSCVSANACMAVGDYDNGSGVLGGLAERWDGSSWSVVPVPDPAGASLTRLFGVSCTAANACTAVGVVSDPATVPLVERWDGSSWSIQPSPNPNPTGSSESSLKSVSCASASACTAVGGLAPTVSSQSTLVERWDGSSWSIQPSPNPSTADDALGGVSCPALGACDAVGSQISGSGPELPLAEGWDGTGWSAQSTPSPGNVHSPLFAVSCLSVSWCMAAGSSQTPGGGNAMPLAELYAAGASPQISTRASAGVPLGGQVHDTATLTGGQAPTGWIIFKLYTPGDTTCALARAFTSRVPVHGDGTYTSGSFTPPNAGTYRFTATYIGDQNNNPASSACGTAGEQVAVAKLTPLLGTTASGTITLGGQVHDTARLLGGRAPTGTITFRLYRPGDTTCTTPPVFKSTITIAGTGTYPSTSYTPTKTGTYRFTALYTGDENNNPVTRRCGASNQHVTVT